MNKELTPLEALAALERIKSHYKDKVCIDVLDDFDIIETALKAFQLIIDRRCDIHYIGFFTIINHELEMSKDETKFVEDVLNESTN